MKFIVNLFNREILEETEDEELREPGLCLSACRVTVSSR